MQGKFHWNVSCRIFVTAKHANSNSCNTPIKRTLNKNNQNTNLTQSNIEMKCHFRIFINTRQLIINFINKLFVWFSYFCIKKRNEIYWRSFHLKRVNHAFIFSSFNVWTSVEWIIVWRKRKQRVNLYTFLFLLMNACCVVWYVKKKTSLFWWKWVSVYDAESAVFN